MSIARVFLDWNQPLLPQAASWLVEHAPRGLGPVDLSGALVVVPVAAAIPRLRELLVDAAGGRVLLPALMTPSEVPESLYRVKKPFASTYTQRMAWRSAMQSLDPEELASVIPKLPRDSAIRAWLSLADLLARQHRELAADALDFQAVAEHGEKIPGFVEHERWRILAHIERRYLDILDKLDLWDRQEARLYAIDHKECASRRQLVFVGTSDLNIIIRKMVDQVAEQRNATRGSESETGAASNLVTALVHANAAQADAFDRYGCIRVDHWRSRPVPITDQQVIPVGDESEQAEQVSVALADIGQALPASEIVIGCPADRGIPLLQRYLTDAGVESHYSVGQSLDRTRPGRLLTAIAAHLELANASSLSDLARNPDVLASIDVPETEKPLVLSQLNDFRSRRYPRHLSASRLDETNEAPKYSAAAAAVRAIEDMIAPLTSSRKRPVGAWSDAILNVLEQVYGVDADGGPQHPFESIVLSFREIIENFRACPTELDAPVASADAIRIVVAAMSDRTARPCDDADGVALTGWLELPLDDRQAVLVTSFNDGVIPTSVTSDLFLPGTLREHLGLNDNHRRFARDAYATTALIHSSRDVRFFVPRFDSEGNPLSPSRILFTNGPDETVATFQHLHANPSPRRSVTTLWTAGASDWDHTIPDLEHWAVPLSPPITMSVTAFRDYLACPYRFYLKHVLRLRPAAIPEDELSAAGFGSLIHAVLSRFGRSNVRHEREPSAIREFVREELDMLAKSRFGSEPLAAIRVQIDKAAERLDGFAATQAALRDDGWHIAFAEQDEEAATTDGQLECDFIDSDDVTAKLKGRIDRIDRHDDGRWRVLDYKTGDSAKQPLAAHRKGRGDDQRWIDLQLPLYRHLAATLNVTGSVETGYFNLPQSQSECGIALFPDSDALFADADGLARDVLARVRLGEFPLAAVPVPFDDFASICQADVLSLASPDDVEVGT